ncbi:MAG: tail fiber domain-containing protein, partial [Patescibacteria group bacterium]|nr:tail fiber domain-containing protein [Patescibacteria group bacterium]
NGGELMGLFNDVDNRWISLYDRNSYYRIYEPDSGNVAMHVSANGHIGINNESPGAMLAIDANDATTEHAIITRTNTTAADLYMDSGGSIVAEESLHFNMDVDNNSTTRVITFGKNGFGSSGITKVMTLAESGSVAIGNFTPSTSHRVEIRGNSTSSNFALVVRNSSATNSMWVRDNGTGYLRAASWSYGSDKRLKENIISTDYGLDEIIQLSPKKFDYIDGSKENLGFIAQDIQSIIPEIVGEDEEGMLSLKMTMFTPILVNAIKEQQDLITTNADDISLNATATSVSGLQAMVEDEFDDVNDRHTGLSLKVDANTLALQTITDIEADITDLQDSLSILTNIDTRVLTLDVDKLMFVSDGVLTQSTVDEDGNEIIEEMAELTLEGLLNTKKIVTEELETNTLTINDNITTEDETGKDVDASSIGSDKILATETEASVKTTAVTSDSRVFVTVRGDSAVDVTLTVVDITDGVFRVSMPKVQTTDVKFDWFVVGGVE